MKKEIINIGKDKFRVTTTDERWYIKEKPNKLTGMPDFTFYPSSTWIAGSYPKGTQFYKWLASKGWDSNLWSSTSWTNKHSQINLTRAQPFLLFWIQIERDGFESISINSKTSTNEPNWPLAPFPETKFKKLPFFYLSEQFLKSIGVFFFKIPSNSYRLIWLDELEREREAEGKKFSFIFEMSCCCFYFQKAATDVQCTAKLFELKKFEVSFA